MSHPRRNLASLLEAAADPVHPAVCADPRVDELLDEMRLMRFETIRVAGLQQAHEYASTQMMGDFHYALLQLRKDMGDLVLPGCPRQALQCDDLDERFGRMTTRVSAMDTWLQDIQAELRRGLQLRYMADVKPSADSISGATMFLPDRVCLFCAVPPLLSFRQVRLAHENESSCKRAKN